MIQTVEVGSTTKALQSLHAFLIQSSADQGLGEEVVLGDGTKVKVDTLPPSQLQGYLAGAASKDLAVAFIPGGQSDQEVPEALREIRQHPELSRTRVFILGQGNRNLPAGGVADFDVEAVIDRESFRATNATRTLEQGVRAYRALGTNPLIPRFYLDTTFNETFDWFETTRWDWNEIGTFTKDQVDTRLLDEDTIEILKESSIIEFGTLPGAHNFLREWGDEYSFSSWALSWGAEEARHSLIQCRYLRTIGIDVPAKHAMYKREPYPMGQNRAGTLMMNIISEARACEYYKVLAGKTQEPVLKKIWTLLGRDEGRHARAFFVFCKEACEKSRENLIAALQMAYVWLADRSQGVRHPAGHFYPHSTSTDGIRLVESTFEGITDASDARVFAMIRNLVGDESVKTVRDLKSHLRALV